MDANVLSNNSLHTLFVNGAAWETKLLHRGLRKHFDTKMIETKVVEFGKLRKFCFNRFHPQMNFWRENSWQNILNGFDCSNYGNLICFFFKLSLWNCLCFSPPARIFLFFKVYLFLYQGIVKRYEYQIQSNNPLSNLQVNGTVKKVKKVLRAFRNHIDAKMIETKVVELRKARKFCFNHFHIQMHLCREKGRKYMMNRSVCRYFGNLI